MYFILSIYITESMVWVIMYFLIDIKGVANQGGGNYFSLLDVFLMTALYYHLGIVFKNV